MSRFVGLMQTVILPYYLPQNQPAKSFFFQNLHQAKHRVSIHRVTMIELLLETDSHFLDTENLKDTKAGGCEEHEEQLVYTRKCHIHSNPDMSPNKLLCATYVFVAHPLPHQLQPLTLLHSLVDSSGTIFIVIVISALKEIVERLSLFVLSCLCLE